MGNFPTTISVGHTGREPVKLPFPVGCTTPVLGGLYSVILPLTRPSKATEEHCDQITTNENEAVRKLGWLFYRLRR